MIQKTGEVQLPLVHYKKGDSWLPWSRDLYQALRPFFVQVVSQLNSQSQGLGATLTAATEINPTSAIHHVTGTTAIRTIEVPSSFPAASLILIPDSVWSLVTGGNIAHATTAQVGRAMQVTFDGTLWYPSY